MKRNFLLCLFNLFYFLCFAQTATADQSHIPLLKEMFEKVTLEKNYQAISLYYDKDFELYSNGKKMDFSVFLKMHRHIYETSI